MKKLTAILLAVILVFSLTLTVLAEGGSESSDLSTSFMTDPIDVNLAYSALPDTSKVYSVNVTWTNTALAYTAGTPGTWAPASHAYVGATPAGWTTDNYVTVSVTNLSNARVFSSLQYTHKAGTTVPLASITASDGTAPQLVEEVYYAERTLEDYSQLESPATYSVTVTYGTPASAFNNTLGSFKVNLSKNT